MGQRPEVTGPAEAILMAVAGRPAVLAGLSGEGLPVLAGRVTQPRAAGQDAVRRDTGVLLVKRYFST
jgi:hypothetical protein